MRLLRRKQWVDFALTQIMSYEFWYREVHIVYDLLQIGDDGHPKSRHAFMPPEERRDWSEFPEDMPILPYPRENILVAYFYLLIQVAMKYDEKLGLLVRKAIEEALDGNKKYMFDIRENYWRYLDNDEDIPLYNHLAQANEDNGLYLNEIYSKFYNQYWDETLDQDSSIDYICKNTLVGFKKNMKELLRQENDDYYDKEYWSEKLEEFFEFFRKKIDLLAESWMIDLCQHKFMF